MVERPSSVAALPRVASDDTAFRAWSCPKPVALRLPPQSKPWGGKPRAWVSPSSLFSMEWDAGPGPARRRLGEWLATSRPRHCSSACAPPALKGVWLVFDSMALAEPSRPSPLPLMPSRWNRRVPRRPAVESPGRSRTMPTQLAHRAWMLPTPSTEAAVGLRWGHGGRSRCFQDRSGGQMAGRAMPP